MAGSCLWATGRSAAPRNAPITLLRYRRDFPIAVVEAKAAYRTAGDGLQQAKEYAQILGLKFAYATNGHSIIEHDFLTGLDNELQTFPKPSELWARLTGCREISRRKWATACSRPITTSPASRRATTRRSPSTAPCRHPAGQEARTPHACHRHRQDHRRVSDLLEAHEFPVEPNRRASPPPHSLSCRPQYPRR